ncbi:MAG: type III pantothenate kinase [Bdellovibrionales bacterium]|nr:type III pantothenate kinase [Bdellovibrionales bacterium]
MLLTFDVGNTNIVVGCFDRGDLKSVFRLKTDLERTVDEYSALLLSLLHQRLGSDVEFSQAIISSVVPPITPDLCRLVRETFGLEPLVVGPGIKTGIAIKTADPAAVGSDRVVNAIAARARFGCPAIVIDFGTATSFDVLSTKGEYEGGIIAPGVKISLDALVKNTAKLPRIELTWPSSVIGKSTISAMQVGTVVGYLCLVEGLVTRLLHEVGETATVIATGGMGRLFAEHSSLIHHYEPNLTLFGLLEIAQQNQDDHEWKASH